MDWNRYFALLSDWKKLLAYKAEPRIDSLIGYYLPQIVADYCHENIIGIIPELPLRLGTLKPEHNDTNYADRSYKVDFYLLDSNGTNYLIEFKTDQGSRREKQDRYLNEAKCIKMKALVDGICQIARVSSYKAKYGHLLRKLSEFGLIDNDGNYSGKSEIVEIIYVEPHSIDDNKCISFEWISNWMKQKYENSEFELEFAQLLQEWAE
ncbi:hypothetical protein ACFLYF_01255 [Chloroflexota bacterium]